MMDEHLVYLLDTFSAHLVPILVFGENEVYTQYRSSSRRGLLGSILQKLGLRLMQFSYPKFYGRGFADGSFGYLPYRHPINCVGELHLVSKANKSLAIETIRAAIYGLLYTLGVHKSTYAAICGGNKTPGTKTSARF